MGAGPVLRLATRGSPLARWQAETVATLLQAAHPGLRVELLTVSTTGDARSDVPVWEIGGQGLFAKEVQAVVASGQAGAAVHSAKDLPSRPGHAPGLVIAAVPERGDPRDALVGAPLAGLGAGALVATGSVRRRAQLAWLRPDLTFTGVRGNIATRLAKCPPGGAVVVAAAALERLGRTSEAAQILGSEVMVPQVGQGAMAVECRSGDTATRDLLAAIDDPPSAAALAAERAFLAQVGGSCDLPVGAFAEGAPGGAIRMEGLLASADGRVVMRKQASGRAPQQLGAEVAEALLGAGGRELLAERAGTLTGGAGR